MTPSGSNTGALGPVGAAMATTAARRGVQRDEVLRSAHKRITAARAQRGGDERGWGLPADGVKERGAARP